MGRSQSKSAFRVETEWIRGYAKTYLPSEAGFSFSPEKLRARGVSIIQVRHVLKNGEVVYADKLDDPGAEWVVIGEDQDGVLYRLELVVVSEAQSVTLRDISPYDEPKEDNNDAA